MKYTIEYSAIEAPVPWEFVEDEVGVDVPASVIEAQDEYNQAAERAYQVMAEWLEKAGHLDANGDLILTEKQKAVWR